MRTSWRPLPKSARIIQPVADEEREIDYLICRECNTPCYIFEMEGEQIQEALCQVCGNDLKARFAIGEVEEE